MELFVNGQKIDFSLEGEETVGEVLRSFEERAAANEATTTGIAIDGQKIVADEIEQYFDKRLDEVSRLELQAVSKAAIWETLLASAKVFRELSLSLEDVPAALQSGKDKQAGETIAKLADEIGDFCRAVEMSSLFPEVHSSLTSGEDAVSGILEEFPRIFGELEQSLKDKDTVASGDICEYEVAPRLKMIAQAVEAAAMKA